MKILCVDDDRKVLDTIRMTLENAKHQVVTATDGSKAVELFRQHEKELAGIFLDIRMKGLDGIGVLKKIRETSRIPAVAVSAYLDKVTVGECEKAGFNGYIQKPCDMKQLLDAARDIFGEGAKKK